MAAEQKFDLRNAEDLIEVVSQARDQGLARVVRELHCSTCRAPRRVTLQARAGAKWAPDLSPTGTSAGRAIVKLPLFIVMLCNECATDHFAVVWQDEDGARHAVVVSSRYSGVATPNTPAGVAYYLDQADRAECVGARTAAVAMYRAALEHLLFEQGYTTGMLNAKIQELIRRRDAGEASGWARDLDADHLTVINRLGNFSIHPNDGDISGQSRLDSGLLSAVRELFSYLVDEVYEREERRRRSLARAREALQPPGGDAT